MKPVDILCDYTDELALLFHFGKLEMGLVWLCPEGDHLIAVEVEKFLGVSFEKAVAQYCFGRIVVFLVIKSVYTAEVRDIALCADACAAEKDDFLCIIYDCLEILHIFTPFKYVGTIQELSDYLCLRHHLIRLAMQDTFPSRGRLWISYTIIIPFYGAE